MSAVLFCCILTKFADCFVIIELVDNSEDESCLNFEDREVKNWVEGCFRNKTTAINIRESGLTRIYVWALFVIIKFLKQANNLKTRIVFFDSLTSSTLPSLVLICTLRLNDNYIYGSRLDTLN